MSTSTGVADVLLVEVPGMEGFVRLIADLGGAIDPATGKLSGAFRLAIGEGRSSPTSFGPSSKVFAKLDNGRWSLTEIARSEFRFDQALVVHDGGTEPWLRATNTYLWLDATTKGIVLLSLEDVSIAMLGTTGAGDANRFFYPTSTGPRSVGLVRGAHPDLPETSVGFFVHRRGGAFNVGINGLDDAPELDAFRVASVSLQRDCPITFRVGGANGLHAEEVAGPRLVIDGSRSSRGMRVIVAQGTQLELPKRRVGGGTYARIDRLEVAGGWARATNFVYEAGSAGRPGEVLLRHVHGAAVVEEDRTRVRGPAERFSFALPLDAADATRTARFLYEDRTVSSQSGPVTPLERTWGLQIYGLGSARGGPVRLDANRLSIALLPTQGGRVFLFQAGVPFDAPFLGDEPPLLVPKRDPVDERSRVLEIPAGTALVTCRHEGTETPLKFDMSKADREWLELINPVIAIPPAGSGATAVTSAATASTGYASWGLRALDGQPLTLQCTDQGAFVAPRWLDRFRGTEAEFRSLDHPGASITLSPRPQRLLDVDAAAADLETTLTTKTDNGREMVVYSAVVALLTYRLVETLLKPNERAVPENAVKVRLAGLTEAAANEWLKRNGIDDLVVVWFGTGGANARMREFIKEQLPEGGADVLVWPVAMRLAMLLKTGNEYGPEIAAARGKRMGIAIDQSSLAGIVDDDLGLDFQSLSRTAPALWPRLSRLPGAALDPSEPFWRGFFFRDVPMKIQVDSKTIEEIRKRVPFLANLFDTIDQNLLLDYGWKDESGATWSGGFSLPDGASILPESWRRTVDIRILGFGTTGSAGRILSSSGTLEVIVPGIRDRATGAPMPIRGAFVLDLTESIALDRVEIVPPANLIETHDIPGFESVRVLRFVTDFGSVQIDVELLPSSELATALPCFVHGKPAAATISVDLRGNAPARVSLSLSLPGEITTNLFGKWPLTVQSLQLGIGGAKNDLRVRGRIGIGSGAFISVGVEVIITQSPANGDWDLDVKLDEIGGRIGIGDFELEGHVAWTTAENQNGGAIAKNGIGDGRNRDFWGLVRLKTGGFLGDPSVTLRFGSHGEMSYWIGALAATAKIDFGPGSLHDPVLVLARHADLGENLMNANPDDVVGLRPGNDLRAWLKTWTPSAKVGLLVAGSGLFELHSEVASKPTRERTGLVVTDAGVLRIDAYAKILKMKLMRFALAVDIPRKRFRAGLQLPSIKYPSEQTPEFEIDAGFLDIEIGYGSPMSFSLKVGWPELIGGSETERNWGSSVKVRWNNMIPINTFWGGFHSAYDGEQKVVRLGWALKAGWTKAYEFLGGIGNASLELSVGGVVELAFWFDAPREPLLLPPSTTSRQLLAATEHLEPLFDHALGLQTADATDIAACVAAIHRDLVSSQSPELWMRGTLYADIKGSASVKLLGVEIVGASVHAYARFMVCGSVVPPRVEKVYAKVGFEFRLKILCVEVKARAELEIWLKRGECHVFKYSQPSRTLALPPVVAGESTHGH